ncbi:MFS general substrate transporter [Teratosphaeria nubilosa]|uniref:MFS general substrate transporter n=1 Tax=Teratosphaeria nubilosa TaxID=161662 RepID=A0A6G1KXK5_9PEZI|nr:MFS general substrate transporter [Teratosphaeria nubilosa]
MAVFKRMSLKQGNTSRTNAAELTLRASIYPLCLVTVLFFLWGFSYGLLDTLNKHFQSTLGINRARSSGLQAAYFGAYPLASLGHANWILRNYGFKPVFIWGLCLYGIGALIAWPCILHRSFGGFCAAIFVIGNGLGSLETAANPYITICGPPRYAEMRINISQAFNGIGTVIAPVLGSYVFFKDTGTSKKSLQNVQWVKHSHKDSSPIPEITDADMAFQAEETHANTDTKPFRKQYRLFHAAFAQLCYTGAQVAIAGYFINYVVETRPHTSSATGARFLAGAQGAFAIGRFIGVLLMKYFRPRLVFFFFLTACIVFLAPSITQRGNTGMSMLYVTLFFESICFPTIVALGMRGLGKYSKRGSGFIVGGVCGGAVVPPILGAVADMHNNTATAMSVPLAFFVAAWTYPICVNFVAAYRIPADNMGEAKIGLQNGSAEEEKRTSPVLGDPEKGGIERIESGSEEIAEAVKH